MTPSLAAVNSSNSYISTPTFDYTAIMGGAALTLALPFVVTFAPATLPLFF